MLFISYVWICQSLVRARSCYHYLNDQRLLDRTENYLSCTLINETKRVLRNRQTPSEKTYQSKHCNDKGNTVETTLNCVAFTKTPELKKEVPTVEVAKGHSSEETAFLCWWWVSLPRNYILRRQGTQTKEKQYLLAEVFLSAWCPNEAASVERNLSVDSAAEMRTVLLW